MVKGALPFDKGTFGGLSPPVWSVSYPSFRLTKKLVDDTWELGNGLTASR